MQLNWLCKQQTPKVEQVLSKAGNLLDGVYRFAVFVPVAMYAAISCSESLPNWTTVVSANVCMSSLDLSP